VTSAPFLLQARDVTIRFDGLVAVDKVSMDIPAGQVRGLIGPNGAGKTTFFNAISGLLPLSGGSIHFGTEDVSFQPAHRRAASGIRRTFQSVQLLPHQTVLENVLVGLHNRLEFNWKPHFPFRRRSGEAEAQAAVEHVLSFLGIRAKILAPVNRLTFAEQRLTEIARAIVSRPRLLLLDEPAAGLSPTEVDQLGDLLHRLRDEWDVTILLVEHVLSLVLNRSDRITVLENGRLIAEGRPDEVANDPLVQAAYLGVE
jgi:branched-chain amino acid transport system ATP-binding protein